MRGMSWWWRKCGHGLTTVEILHKQDECPTPPKLQCGHGSDAEEPKPRRPAEEGKHVSSPTSCGDESVKNRRALAAGARPSTILIAMLLGGV
jgi:hypothetical protein